MKGILVAALALLSSGCVSGNFEYVKPVPQPPPPNWVIVEKPKHAVWQELVSQLSTSFWTINTIDKDSGFINLSFRADPARYLDCGTIKSEVNDVGGSRSYVFNAARADMSYQGVEGQEVVSLNRKLNLDGRINVVVRELAPNQTEVTVNTNYVLGKITHIDRTLTVAPRTNSETISFNSGQGGTFSGNGTQCFANGQLEAAILGMVKPAQATATAGPTTTGQQ